MALTPGTRLGPYEITAQIGVGGMGEVWCATDTNLGRQVAIKILPDAFAHDPERLARFEREAKTLASLNHQNIAIIHGLEKADGIRALVMELVEGPTLADRIGRGPIPIDEALPIAKQIAEALEAAHQHGIIHRDLKPANIKVRPDGTVKVLDFGLAKAIDPEPTAPDLSESPTFTRPGLTGAGVVLGTAAYMSPEQALGKATDVRSDIWAFGAVLFEMLSGRPVFAGETALELLSSALKTDPDWTTLPAATPPVVRSLLRRCLQKDPSHRLRDIADARFQIEEVMSEPTVPPIVGAAGRKSRERIVWVAGLVAVAAVAAGSTRYLSPPQDVGDEIRFEVTTQPTTDPTSFAISPDGKTLVFEAISNGTSHLWLRSLDTVSVRPLAGTEGATRPFWSPDSRLVGFSVNGQVNGIDIETGTLQRLGHAGAWNHDGTILFSMGGGGPIYRVSASGGEPTAVTPILQGSDQLAPQSLPDGRHFLFTASGGSTPGLYVALLGDSVAPRRIVEDAEVGTYSSGHLLFVRKGTLFAQPFDPVRLQLDGRVTTIADQIVATGGRSFALSASSAGPIAYRTGPPVQAQFVWYDRSGAPLEAIAGSDIASFLHSSLSPDGRFLAISRNAEGQAADIWLLDLRRGVPTRLTVDPAFDLIPVWSPDSRRIAYASNRKGTADLYVQSADRTGSEELLAGGEIGPPSDWSPDGRFILAARERGPGDDIWAVPVNGDRKAFPVVETKSFQESNGQFSPDGNWIAFQSNESGRREIYVQPFPGPGLRTQISRDGGVQARWRDDGKELFFLAPDDRLMSVRIQLDLKNKTVEAATPVSLFAARLPTLSSTTLHSRHYMVSPDGQRFLVQTAKEATLPITVILNLKPRS